MLMYLEERVFAILMLTLTMTLRPVCYATLPVPRVSVHLLRIAHPANQTQVLALRRLPHAHAIVGSTQIHPPLFAVPATANVHAVLAHYPLNV